MTGVVLLAANFKVLVGTANPAVNALPALLPLLTVAGVGYAFWLRANRPARYADIASAADRPREEAPEVPSHVP